MNSPEFLKKICDLEEGHVKRVVEGLSEAELDATPLTGMMSAREQLAHLCECYVAFSKEAKGEKHEWGTFQVQATDGPSLMAEWKQLRDSAVDAAVTSEDPKMWVEAVSFIQNHDEYHVGQLCAMRLQMQPDWNPYAIYE